MQEQQPQAPKGLPDNQEEVATEQSLKTLAVRVDENTHTQLRFIAQLRGSKVSEEIRAALEQRIESAQQDLELVARAQQARTEIDREAIARIAAIANFLGKPATAASTGASGRPSARKK